MDQKCLFIYKIIFDMYEENCGCAFSRISGVNHTMPTKLSGQKRWTHSPPHPSQGGMGLNPTVTSLTGL